MQRREITLDQLAEMYRQAFDHVANPADWRGPIDCYVPWEVSNIYVQAIEFMTGVAPDCEYISQNARTLAHITCVGYRNGPCGG
jgi:hypothetical protein